MSISLYIGWWLFPFVMTLFLYLLLYLYTKEDSKSYGYATIGSSVIKLIFFLLATIASLICWVIYFALSSLM